MRMPELGLGQGFAPIPPEPREPYPAPEVSSRDPWDGTGVPGPVAKLAESAVAASWDVRVQRSRGSVPHAVTGRAGAVKTLYAVVGRRSGQAFYAVRDPAGWTTITVWSDVRPWFSMCTISDLTAYVLADGDLGDEWFTGIRVRARAAEIRAKAKAKARPKPARKAEAL